MMKWSLFFLLNISIFANAQQMLMPYAIQDSIFKQLELFPQEKVHLHTDRSTYVHGEKVWFKVYLVDALTNRLPSKSQYVYVELINASDSLLQRVLVSADENGLFHGHITLSEKMSEGDYTLRAYTRYMNNLGDDYFFKKNIRIWNISETKNRQASNPSQNMPLSSQMSDSSPMPSLVSQQGGFGDDYDVTFFPEGGYITEGAINHVAFKAINQHGESEFITGEIVDNEGNQIVPSVLTYYAGMGSFAFGTAAGKSYFLTCKNSAGQAKRFPLPTIRKTCTITTHNRENHFFITLNKSPDIPQRPYYILMHCRGEVFYYAQWDYRKEYMMMSYNDLPYGVIQIMLLDEQMNPISERLVFNSPTNQTNLSFTTDKAIYTKRDRVSAKVSLPPVGSGVADYNGNISISITDNADISVDSLNTITASLLLSSELRGYIESPDYYLQDNREAKLALDYLMMTHGWRRYELSETIKGNYKHPETAFELAKEISGSVKTYLTSRSVADREVILLSTDQSMMRTTTDTDGKFRYQLHYPDSSSFFVMANNRFGRENVKITLNPEIFPTLKHAPVSMSLFPVIAVQEKEQTDSAFDFLKKAGQRAQYEEDIKIINLEEVEVTAQRIELRDRLRLITSPYNASAEITLYREEMEHRMRNPLYVADYIYMVPGAKVEYSIDTGQPVGIQLRTMAGGNALIYIDGVESTIEELNALPSVLVESIDVIRGVSASILGVRGAGGAVSVTTGYASKSSESKSNTTTIAPLGYQKPVDFYSPKYDTAESKNFSIPDYRTTIFWKPDLFLSANGEASFEFYTSDFPTTYSVVIEGLTNEGTIIRQVERINISY